MYQSDIAELRQDQVDWQGGSSVAQQDQEFENVPTVNFLLRPKTIALLRRFRFKIQELALDETGRKLRLNAIQRTASCKDDVIGTQWKRFKGLRSLGSADQVHSQNGLQPSVRSVGQNHAGLSSTPEVHGRYHIAPLPERHDEAIMAGDMVRAMS
jgi:hypothetical protein